MRQSERTQKHSLQHGQGCHTLLGFGSEPTLAAVARDSNHSATINHIFITNEKLKFPRVAEGGGELEHAF